MSKSTPTRTATLSATLAPTVARRIRADLALLSPVPYKRNPPAPLDRGRLLPPVQARSGPRTGRRRPASTSERVHGGPLERPARARLFQRRLPHAQDAQRAHAQVQQDRRAKAAVGQRYAAGTSHCPGLVPWPFELPGNDRSLHGRRQEPADQGPAHGRPRHYVRRHPALGLVRSLPPLFWLEDTAEPIVLDRTASAAAPRSSRASLHTSTRAPFPQSRGCTSTRRPTSSSPAPTSSDTLPTRGRSGLRSGQSGSRGRRTWRMRGWTPRGTGARSKTCGRRAA